MRRVTIQELRKGDIVAIDIYDSRGSQLLKKKSELTDKNIEKIRSYKIPFIYIKHDEIAVNSIFNSGIVAELLKVLSCFISNNGKNTEILKRYNVEEINRFASYNNEAAGKIAYGHIFRYFINELIKNLEAAGEKYYDFIDYRSADSYGIFHAVNAACISLLLGYRMNLERKELVDLGTGALLYDLKMDLYSFINQERELDEAEKEEMREHTYLSFDTIRKIYGISAKSANIAYQHHERLDGSGYPKKLRGDGISLFSRIVAVADVYDALISARPFRKPYFSDEAWEYISGNSGVLFDPVVAGVFKRAIAKYWPGDTVELSNGKQGVVVRNNPENMERPVIKVIEKTGKSDIISGAETGFGQKKDVLPAKVVLSAR